MRYGTGLFILLAGSLCGPVTAYAQGYPFMARYDGRSFEGAAPPAVTGAATPCVDGSAGGYACLDVDLMAFVPLGTFGSAAANDIWGWTDPQTGREYALIGLNDGTGFVDITDPANPVYLGKLPTHTSNSSWRDVKVYADHAFVVSEAGGHGMQVFDLTLLRDVSNPPATFAETAHYGGFGGAHNLAVNEATGFAYAVGTGTCAGGLHMIDVQNPTAPTEAGCFDGDGYTHDAQCVVYAGPDAVHQGREICFNANEDTVTIVDVTDKSNPVQLSRTGYPTSRYVHQGWLDEDHRYFYQNDELDSGNTRTMIWDVTDLDDPIQAAIFTNTTTSRDHNLYIVGDLMYQANYTTGLRVIDISDRLQPVEIAFFDTYAPSNSTSFSGAWSNYPFFDSGIVIVSSIGEGLFILRPDVFSPAVSISGRTIFYDGATAVEGTALDLSGDDTQTTVAAPDGSYDFVVERHGSYTVTPRLDADAPPSQGVNTLDIAFMRQHILGIQALGSPYKIIAADVDNSDAVNTLDVAFVRQLILGMSPAFPGGLWRFVASDYAFVDPADPLSEAFPEVRSYPSIPGSAVQQDFTAIKHGDVTGDWAAAARAKQAVEGVVHLSVGAPETRADGEVVVPVHVASGFEDVGGLQFTLEWDREVLAYVGVEGDGLPGLSEEHFGTRRAAEGLLTLAWDDADLAGKSLPGGSTLFAVHFRIAGEGVTPVQVTSGLTAAFAHRAGDLAAYAVAGAPNAVSVAAEAAPGVPEAFELSPNYPNPFNPVTTIAYALPHPGRVRLHVYNARGQRVETLVDAWQEAGRYRVPFDAAGLPSGVYYYRLTQGAEARQGQMVLLK